MEPAIDLKRAKNQLNNEEILRKFRQIYGETKLEPSDLLQMSGPSWGLIELRRTFAKFIQTNFKPKFHMDPENIFIINGVTSALNIIAQSICNAGDQILCPVPNYHRLWVDMVDRAKADLLQIPCVNLHKKRIQLDFGALEKEIKTDFDKIKGIVLVNPNNPTGQILTEPELLEIRDFAEKNNLFLIANEIYALSSNENGPKFESLLKFSDSENLIWTWSMSKDFCLTGLRIGAIYTKNPKIQRNLQLLSEYHQCPPILQKWAQKFLEDETWIDSYLKENQRKLSSARTEFQSLFNSHGVEHFPADHGLFLFAKLGKGCKTIDDERKILQKLSQEFGIQVIGGSDCRMPEFGWFRIVVCVPENERKSAIERLETFIKS